MPNSQKIHNIKLKLTADTEALTTVKKELTSLEQEIVDTNKSIRRLQSHKTNAKKGFLADDITNLNDMQGEVAELIADLHKLEQAKKTAGRGEKAPINNKLRLKRNEIERVYNKIIADQKDKLDDLTLANKVRGREAIEQANIVNATIREQGKLQDRIDQEARASARAKARDVEKAARAAEKAAEKVARTEERAADKAERAAEKVARAKEKAAEKAARVEEKAAEKAEKALREQLTMVQKLTRAYHRLQGKVGIAVTKIDKLASIQMNTAGLVRHIRQLESVVVGIYAIKKAWDLTLGAGLAYNIEMEDLDIKLKGIIGSTATMQLSDGTMLNSVVEKWKMAGEMAKGLKEDLKQVAIDTSSEVRDASRVLGAFMPQALAAGASTKELTKLTKGFLIAMKTGSLTAKEAINGLDNVVNGESMRGELINYLKTLGISMKDMKNAKGHEAIVLLIEKLERLEYIVGDIKNSFRGMADNLKNQYLMAMGDAVATFEGDVKKSMGIMQKYLKENKDTIVITTRAMYATLKSVVSDSFATATPYVKKYVGLLKEGVVVGARMVKGLYDFGISIYHSIIHPMGEAIAKFTHFASAGDMMNFVISNTVVVATGLVIFGTVTKLVYGFGKAVFKLSGLSLVFKALIAGVRGVGLAFTVMGGIAKATLGIGIAKSSKNAVGSLGVVGGAIASLTRRFKQFLLLIGGASAYKSLAKNTAKLGAGLRGGAWGLAATAVGMALPEEITGIEQVESIKDGNVLMEKYLKERRELTIFNSKALQDKSSGGILGGLMSSYMLSPKEVKEATDNIDNQMRTLGLHMAKIGKEEFGADSKTDTSFLDKIMGGGAKGNEFDGSQFDKIIKGLTEATPLFKLYTSEIDKATSAYTKLMKPDIDDTKKLTFDVPKTKAQIAEELAELEKANAKKKRKRDKEIRELNTFNAAYIRETQGKEAGEIAALQKKRDAFISQGQDEAKIKEWYEQAKLNITKKYHDKTVKAAASASRKLGVINRKAEAAQLKATKAILKIKKHEIKITKEFANEVAEANLTPKGKKLYDLDVKKKHFMDEKVSQLAIDVWYLEAKAKIVKEYADKARDDKLKALSEYYKITNRKNEYHLLQFQTKVSAKMLKLMKQGLSPEKLSAVYDAMYKANEEKYDKSTKRMLSISKGLVSQLESAFSSFTSQFAKTGKFDIESAVKSFYNGFADTLKSMPDPYSKAIGYGMDLVQGVARWAVGGDDKNPINAFGESKSDSSILKGLELLNGIHSPMFGETRRMRENLERIDTNILAIAKGTAGVDVGTLTGSAYESSSSGFLDGDRNKVLAGLALVTGGLSALFLTKEKKWAGSSGIAVKGLNFDGQDAKAVVSSFLVTESQKTYALGLFEGGVKRHRDDEYSKALTDMVNSTVDLVRDNKHLAQDMLGLQRTNTIGASANFDLDLSKYKDDEEGMQKAVGVWLNKISAMFVDGSNLKVLEKFSKPDENLTDTTTRVMGIMENSMAMLKKYDIKMVDIVSMTGGKLDKDRVVRESIRARETTTRLVGGHGDDTVEIHINPDGTQYMLSAAPTIEKSISNIGKYVDKLNMSGEKSLELWVDLKALDIGLTQFNLSNFSEAMLTGLNSSKELTDGFKGYVKDFTTQEEQKALGITYVDKELARVGLKLPKLASEYKAMVKEYSKVGASDSDLKKAGVLYKYASQAKQYMTDDLKIQEEKVAIQKGEKDYLKWRSDQLNKQLTMQKNVYNALLASESVSAKWKLNATQSAIGANARYGTKDSTVEALKTFMSTNEKYGSGYDAYLQQQQAVADLAAYGNEQLGTLHNPMIVTDTTSKENNDKLVEQLAQMAGDIAMLTSVTRDNSDAFGRTPVVIVGDER